PPPCLDVLKVWQATAQHGGFFSARSESPTSTLNAENEGKEFEASVHESSTSYSVEDYAVADLDPITSDFNFMGACDYLQEFEESRSCYWNNLLTTSPLLYNN
ncbi:hypothetical protein M569_09228, partial [Genlisea aurea]